MEEGALSPHITQRGLAGGLHAKFRLDPSNRLTTIHQRHRQDMTDNERSDDIGRIVYKRSPKNRSYYMVALWNRADHYMFALCFLLS